MKAAEVVLVQMGQNQEVDFANAPLLQKLQQGLPPPAGELPPVDDHGFFPVLRIQQENRAVCTAHIQHVKLAHTVNVTSSPIWYSPSPR